MIQIINIADLVNPKTGKTYREENNALIHKYKVGDLVEIIPWEDNCEYAGMRLYIIGCVRDCDGTPLYVLGSRDMELYQKAFVKPNVCYNFKSYPGFGEESLKLINTDE